MSGKPTAKIERVDKPWGYELIWAKTGNYVGKLLFVKAGQSLSLQYHRKKEETMFLESGEVLLETGPDEDHLEKMPFREGETFHITPGTLHRINAVRDTRLFEVSTPHLDDVVRLKDRYGRG